MAKASRPTRSRQSSVVLASDALWPFVFPGIVVALLWLAPCSAAAQDTELAPLADSNSAWGRSAVLRMLEGVTSRAPEAFFDHVPPDRNARRVDAFAAVYAMLHVLGPGDAELLAYDQYRELETESRVSYASVALY